MVINNNREDTKNIIRSEDRNLFAMWQFLQDYTNDSINII